MDEKEHVSEMDSAPMNFDSSNKELPKVEVKMRPLARIKPQYLLTKRDHGEVEDEDNEKSDAIDVPQSKKPKLENESKQEVATEETDEKEEQEMSLSKEIEDPTASCATPSSTDSGVQLNRHQKRNQEKKKRKKERQVFMGMCKAILKGLECPFKDKCKFSHDLEGFLKEKKTIEGQDCYFFKKYQWCPYGFGCAFLHSHVTPDNKLIGDPNVIPEDFPKELNTISKESLAKLKKRQFPTPKSTPLIKILQAEKKTRIPGQDDAVGYFVETPLKPEEKKQVDFRGKTYLAPLTTTGNLPFRRICKEFGVDITCGEMAVATHLLQGHASEWALVRRHPSEDLFGVQLCGAFFDSMSQCAETLDQTIKADFIDINAGCPIDLIYNKGCGASLIEHKRKLWDLSKCMNRVTSAPITLKARIGKDEKAPTLHKWIHEVENWGISAITVHGRSRQQRYSREANWEYIDQCAKLTKLPLIGNGDVYNYEEYWNHMENTSIATIMVARGALIKPWIFTEIKEKRHWDISSSERLEIIKNFVNYGLEHWGSDDQGVTITRNFLLEWMCFLYRYVPVGLLEVLPSTIAQKVPRFFGRDEMETLLASPAVKDWIKISELFLGKVPPGFSFTPKHQASTESNG